MESIVPSWCLVWSASPLSVGPGTLDNYDSETDASFVSDPKRRAEDNFPSQQICALGLCESRHYPGRSSGPRRHLLVYCCTATAQRSDTVRSGVRMLSPQKTWAGLCVRVLPASKTTKRTRRFISPGRTRLPQLGNPLAAQAHCWASVWASVCLSVCVRTRNYRGVIRRDSLPPGLPPPAALLPN